MVFISHILPWLQIILAILLVTGILLQQNQEGLGSAFGGSGSGGVVYSKRGFEKNLFIITIILAILFALANILTLFIH